MVPEPSMSAADTMLRLVHSKDIVDPMVFQVASPTSDDPPEREGLGIEI